MSSKFPQRSIGGMPVHAIGLGCMGMSFGANVCDDEESLRVLTQAADMGINFWNTSDRYGSGHNEELIGRWFQKTCRRDEIVLCTKFGAPAGVDGVICGTPEHVKRSCEESLKRLQTDYIDLYSQHRVDPKTPIEHTVQAMVELKKEGKIRELGLSECSARTLRRACAVHPIAAAEMEFSAFALEIESEETDFLRTARQLGVKIVA
jgi:aryl-alcohol dehydrogenase-like predicted oxidoreductase